MLAIESDGQNDDSQTVGNNGTTQVMRSKVFFNESEAQVCDRLDCFELFEIFHLSMKDSGTRLGRNVSEIVQSEVWRAICNGNRRPTTRGRYRVKKSQPVVAKELLIVKSCKRKVRW